MSISTIKNAIFAFLVCDSPHVFPTLSSKKHGQRMISDQSQSAVSLDPDQAFDGSYSTILKHYKTTVFP